MNKFLFFILLLCINSFSVFSAYKLENDFGYLQDITFELYDANVSTSKVPEHIQSIEETLMYDVLHAVWIDNKWVAYTLNKNLLGTYKVGSPTIIENNETKKMFFIANFPGTKGGTDLYMSEFKDELWSKPKNMGHGINTPNNESNTGMLDENNLTFSSNGVIKKLNINNYALEDALVAEIKKTTEPTSYIVSTTTATKEEIKETTKPASNIYVENKITNNTFSNEHLSLGKMSTQEVKGKYPLAIQIGSYMNPNWNILNQFSNIGQLITYKNERDLNAVWLTGFSSIEQMNSTLEKVRQYSSFEKSFIVK